MELFNNGKVIVTDVEINIKKTFGSSKVQRRHVKEINYVTGFMRYVTGIMNIVMIVGIPRGIKMLSGQIYTMIYLHNGKKYDLWLTEDEYNEFSNVV